MSARVPHRTEYKREIDGLRGIAVVAVVLCHANVTGFRGGFVGVDVFFVISGFLITRLILAEQRASTFTLSSFYERRARRILPALFVVLFACLPLAWFSLLPGDMKRFAASLAATAGFASNMLFSMTTGYFSPRSQLEPLQHLWTLGVEEQFYLIFPLLFLIVPSVNRRSRVGVWALIGLTSLVGAHRLAASHPSLAFFLMPTRFWELLVGVVIACSQDAHTAEDAPSAKRTSGVVQQWLSGTGLLMILIAVVAFDQTTPFPDVAATVPAIGAALVILFARPHTTVGKLLGANVFVKIGLTSYSVYLWHQPLLAFARRRAPLGDGVWLTSGCVALSFALAYLTWRYVETPFRDRRRSTRAMVFLGSAAGSVLFASIGVFGYVSDGDVGQVDAQRRSFLAYFNNDRPDLPYFSKAGIIEHFRFDCDFYDLQAYREGRETMNAREAIATSCYTATPNSNRVVLLWGDSHAQQFNGALRRTLPPEWSVLQVASSGCQPRLGASATRSDYCAYSNWFAVETIRSVRPAVVLVAQDDRHDVGAMQSLMAFMLSAGVGKVLFVGPTPHWRVSLPEIASTLLPHPPRRTMLLGDQTVRLLDARLQRTFPTNDRAAYVSVIDYFCNADGCLLYYGDDLSTGITSNDDGHLTPIAAQHFAEDVLARAVMR